MDAPLETTTSSPKSSSSSVIAQKIGAHWKLLVAVGLTVVVIGAGLAVFLVLVLRDKGGVREECLTDQDCAGLDPVTGRKRICVRDGRDGRNRCKAAPKPEVCHQVDAATRAKLCPTLLGGVLSDEDDGLNCFCMCGGAEKRLPLDRAAIAAGKPLCRACQPEEALAVYVAAGGVPDDWAKLHPPGGNPGGAAPRPPLLFCDTSVETWKVSAGGTGAKPHNLPPGVIPLLNSSDHDKPALACVSIDRTVTQCAAGADHFCSDGLCVKKGDKPTTQTTQALKIAGIVYLSGALYWLLLLLLADHTDIAQHIKLPERKESPLRVKLATASLVIHFFTFLLASLVAVPAWLLTRLVLRGHKSNMEMMDNVAVLATFPFFVDVWSPGRAIW